MSHSFTSSLYHCVFSTKGRRCSISRDLQSRLWPYMGGIARKNRIRALTIGGVEDHVHLLLSMPSTLAIADALQLIKGGTSAWVHETFPQHHGFTWQEGYGAFSLGISQVDRTIAYIESQAEHHRKRSFQDESVYPAINRWAIIKRPSGTKTLSSPFGTGRPHVRRNYFITCDRGQRLVLRLCFGLIWIVPFQTAIGTP